MGDLLEVVCDFVVVVLVEVGVSEGCAGEYGPERMAG